MAQEVVSISDLPIGEPTHLVGVSVNTRSTVKYPVESFFLQRRHDLNIYSYCGKAPAGKGENEPVWTISRIEILEDGTTNTITLENVSWANRYNLNYN